MSQSGKLDKKNAISVDNKSISSESCSVNSICEIQGSYVMPAEFAEKFAVGAVLCFSSDDPCDPFDVWGEVTEFYIHPANKLNPEHKRVEFKCHKLDVPRKEGG